LNGHRYPVKKCKFSPHHAKIIASGSYDMNLNVWDIANMTEPLIKCHSSHTEFVVGLDFNLFKDKQIASCSWDGRTVVWDWDKP
jgi:peroxin-7